MMSTGAIFPSPSALSGVARLFDFWGLFDAYHTVRDERLADSMAAEADWRAVGDDLQAAIDQHHEDWHKGQLALFKEPTSR